MDTAITIPLAALVGIFLLAGAVKGLTGMGLPTIAMGLLGLGMPPAAAAAMLVVPSMVTNVWQLAAGPALGPLMRRLWPMLLGLVVGTIAGAGALATTDPSWSGFALGLALIGYAGHALLAPPLTVPGRQERWWSPTVGVATGAVTGTTGVFVIPAVPYLQALGLQRDTLVQALGLSFTISTLALAIGLGAHGAFRFEQAGLSALAVVPALAGMWLGGRLRQRIPPARFRVWFLVCLLLLGLELASRPWR
ncbi:sulfite exporter TauE/SafE family protein [Luteimonas sp. TWI662]|uniref:sulfite exporter TauE/SafE family protein n=1 Tax=Luteimonas sp. TWI662 TaxID=3136789 RepID=UPI00320AB9C7